MTTTDYWLSKLMYDLASPELKARWKADRAAVADDYPLSPEARRAVLEDDIAFFSANVNAYLLRFHMTNIGMNDEEALARLHALKPQQEETAHG